jgi:hypothetical protein
VERSGDNLNPPGDSVIFHIPPNPFEFYNLEDERIALSFATDQQYDYPDDLSDPHIAEVVDLAPILTEIVSRADRPMRVRCSPCVAPFP